MGQHAAIDAGRCNVTKGRLQKSPARARKGIAWVEIYDERECRQGLIIDAGMKWAADNEQGEC